MRGKKKFFIAMAATAAVCVVFVALSIVTGLNKPHADSVFDSTAQFSRVESFDGGYLVATRSNELIAVSASGEELWKDDGYKNMVVSIRKGSGDYAYIAAGNKIYRISLADGVKTKEFASYENNGNTFSFASVTDIAVDEAQGVIAVSHGSNKSRHNLTLINMSDSSTVFHTAVGVTADTVEIYGGKIYLGSDNGTVRVFDGEGKATELLRMEDDVTDIAAHDGRIYALSDGGFAAGIDVSTGEVICEGNLGKDDPLLSPCRITADDSGVFAASSDGRIFVFDRDLKKKNTVETDGGVADISLCGNSLAAAVSGKGIVSYETQNLFRNNGALFVIFVIAAALCFAGALTFAVMGSKTFKSKVFKAGAVIWRHRTAYIMLLPIFGLLAVFGFYPVIVAAVRAFTDWSSASVGINFIGLKNFEMMISEGYFLTGVKNLLIFLVSYVVKILTVPLLVAVMVYSLARGRSKYVFRYLFVLPMVVPSVVSALMWKNIYDPNFGLLNKVLEAIGLGRCQTSWLSNPDTAIPALIFVGFPFIDPFSFLIYYSAMVNIPASTLEAARLDGASPVRRFFSIILPSIASQIKVLLVLGFINQIQDFNLILLLTQGGPGTSTYVPGYELYLNATSFGRYGYACALGLVMFVVIFFGTAVMNRIKVNADVE